MFPSKSIEKYFAVFAWGRMAATVNLYPEIEDFRRFIEHVAIEDVEEDVEDGAVHSSFNAVVQGPRAGLDPVFEFEDQQHGGDDACGKTRSGDQIVDAGRLETEGI